MLDPRPLGSSPIGGPDVLFRLYNETGGRGIINTNMPSTRLDDIITDASAYYLLGYTPSREFADGKFHRIDVKVKQKGMRVFARRGWLHFTVISFCLAVSVCYELIEWAAALVSAEAAESFLGTQGDNWDTQIDMFLAGIGSLVSLFLLKPLHDRSIAKIHG